MKKLKLSAAVIRELTMCNLSHVRGGDSAGCSERSFAASGCPACADPFGDDIEGKVKE